MVSWRFHPVRVVFFVLIGAAFCSAASTEPGGSWTVTTSDFKSLPASDLKVDDSGITATVTNAEPRKLAWDDFLSAERTVASSTPAGRFKLHLANRDHLSGEPVSIDAQSLRWSNPVIGEIDFDLAHVARIVRQGADQRADSPTSDVIVLTNGDEVSGIIAQMSDKTFQVQAAGGDPVSVPLDSIVSVRFAATGREPVDAAQRVIRATLSDGSVLSASSLSLDSTKAELVLAQGGKKRACLPAALASIEQVNGPVAWLSSLPPSRDEQIPFLGQPVPSRMDRNVAGETLRFGEQTFAHGIGVHARSVLTWPLDGRYSTFRTRYAIDGDLPYANVTVRIRLDDTIAHERADFTAGELSPVIELPLKNAKSITLEVDYGQTNDVQDRFNWIEPALLKPAPSRR